MRNEYHSKGIRFTMIVPGPVATQLIERASGQMKWNRNKLKRSLFLQPDRCAELMAVSIANEVGESWLAKNPVLAYIYLFTYGHFLSGFIFSRIKDPAQE